MNFYDEPSVYPCCYNEPKFLKVAAILESHDGVPSSHRYINMVVFFQIVLIFLFNFFSINLFCVSNMAVFNFFYIRRNKNSLLKGKCTF